MPGVVSLRHPGIVPGDLKVNFSPAGVGEYPAAGHNTVVSARRTFHPLRSKCFHEEVPDGEQGERNANERRGVPLHQERHEILQDRERCALPGQMLRKGVLINHA